MSKRSQRGTGRVLPRDGLSRVTLTRQGKETPAIAPSLYAARRVTVDSMEQAVEIGDLHHALASVEIGRDHVYVTLAELITGTKPGRLAAAGITLSIALAWARRTSRPRWPLSTAPCQRVLANAPDW